MEALIRSSSCAAATTTKLLSINRITNVHRFFAECPKLNKIVDISSSSSLSVRCFKLNDSISSSSSWFSLKTQANVDNSEALTDTRYESKTVRVRFQLQKECVFGEQFFLVGDDPIIGLWDPESAIPLDWSKEHVWTVELDLPTGKPVLYKFVLKGTTEEVYWQPGPDRILQTWDTKNTILVLEDWENAENQKITEEPSKDIGLNVSGNDSYPKGEPVVNTDVDTITENTTAYVIEESKAEVVREKKDEPLAKLKEESLVAENILKRNSIVDTDKKPATIHDEECWVAYVGEPVLVPGLTSLPNITTEEVLSVESENNNVVDASKEADQVQGLGEPEVTV
ncbi:hypothetical protein IFM89_035443 [Coptis chinensis]|uniref:CBM20 domain-containing protein n=1 Tax=Coptis chinensis TaxID=261450 RepID=A0A835HIW7_9MAGN|nr:hypothetical protein IFM89_035443 [Coptis chinensis]